MRKLAAIFNLKNYSDYSKRIVAHRIQRKCEMERRGKYRRNHRFVPRYRINKTSFATRVKVRS